MNLGILLWVVTTGSGSRWAQNGRRSFGNWFAGFVKRISEVTTCLSAIKLVAFVNFDVPVDPICGAQVYKNISRGFFLESILESKSKKTAKKMCLAQKTVSIPVPLSRRLPKIGDPSWGKKLRPIWIFFGPIWIFFGTVSKKVGGSLFANRMQFIEMVIFVDFYVRAIIFLRHRQKN